MSKKTDNYTTDKKIMAVFKSWFDPCTLSKGEFRKWDGLGGEWNNKTFVNPPYSNPLPWVIKAIKESKKGKTIVLLLKVDTSTKWFKLLFEADALFLWISRRLKYNTGKTAPFPSMLVILEAKK